MPLTRKFRVLVVEHGKSNRSLLLAHLRDSPLEVENAAPDNDVMAACTARPPDLIILDADGDNEGIELCRRLKADPETVSLPVLMLSETAARKMSSFDAGVDEFMTRDVMREEFLVRVNALLRVGATRRAHAAAQLEAEVKRRERLRETFQRYVSPRVVDQIMRQAEATPSDDSRQGTRMHAAVLFVDMRGFTRLAEKIPAREVVPLLNEYFSLLNDIAFQHEGTVFSMAGDSLMIGFGVPLPQEDASVRAVVAGREMIAGYEDLATHWRELHGVETGIGVGINEGDVVAGNVGSDEYMNYTIVGDTVNIAARLCQRARAGEVLFAESVMRSLERHQYAEGAIQLPPMVLRGRVNPINMYCFPAKERKEIREE